MRSAGSNPRSPPSPAAASPAQELYGSMDCIARHGDKRSRPAELIPGTLRVISVGLDYGRRDDQEAWETLADGERAYVARYALGRDYHKLMRQRLQRLAERIAEVVGPFGHRVFVDSAPVLERALARNAGLGWIGKHTCLIDRNGGSWFFLGEIYVDLPLPVDTPATPHCGTCTRCIDVCPTGAITAPYRLDARRCISYLTIEHEGAIPLELREPIGNRIFGCSPSVPTSPISAPATTSTKPAWPSCSPGRRRSSCNGPRGRPSGAAATSAGSATSPSPWATRRPRRKWLRRWSRVGIATTDWCANTSNGRSRGTALRRATRPISGATVRPARA